MKKIVFLFSFLLCLPVFSQQEATGSYSLEAGYFFGTIAEHNPDIGHLITAQPKGFWLQYNKKTYGKKSWERRYNYPDWGFSFLYQNTGNPDLGEQYGAYSHLSWYFLKRYVKLQVGSGLSYANTPYHPDENYRNNAYGSHLLSTTFLNATVGKEIIWNGFGFRAGIMLVHYSNGNFKAPNTSTNTIALTAGLSYQPDAGNVPDYVPYEKERYSEPIRLQMVFRFGMNESDVIGLGKFPFYIFSVAADKRISKKSTFLAGSEFFLSQFLKEYIAYRAVAYPEDASDGTEDYKRAGVYGGYELRFNKVAAFVHLGYYVYYPYDFEGRVYNRLGIKRFFGKKEKLFALVNVRAHAAKAEAMEFGIGMRW